jgi:hypothetical protein
MSPLLEFYTSSICPRSNPPSSSLRYARSSRPRRIVLLVHSTRPIPTWKQRRAPFNPHPIPKNRVKTTSAHRDFRGSILRLLNIPLNPEGSDSMPRKRGDTSLKNSASTVPLTVGLRRTFRLTFRPTQNSREFTSIQLSCVIYPKTHAARPLLGR